jgi:hypothetical protein
VVVGVTLVVAGNVSLPAVPAEAEIAGSISGRAFQDQNRNATLDPGETPFPGHKLYLFDASGSYRGQATTDADGWYGFTGLTAGEYDIQYSGSAWSPLYNDWAPTTTGSLEPRARLTVTTATSMDFGWRPLTWSTQLGAPISSYQGPGGLRSESYNDAVAAEEIHDLVLRSGLVGPEATNTVVRVGYGDITSAATSIAASNGTYTSVTTAIYISWSAWLLERDAATFHEYGHAWSLYNAYVVQQDGSFASYLAARGLTGDSRVGTSYQWSPGEMIAEDYRQLFGTPAGQARAQANPDIPPAAAIAGLRTFLAETFTTPPAAPPPPPPPPAPAVTGLVMSPADVVKTGTVSYTLSTQGTATVTILDGQGRRVRTLVNGASQPAGPVSLTWDRTNDAGRRVKAGPYRVQVDVTAPGGATSASAGFRVA